MRLVVDASIAVKWFIPEVHAEAARRALRDENELLAPDLIWAEVGNVFWKKCRRGELAGDVARNCLRDFRAAPIMVSASEALVDAAWEVAGRFGRSFYDSLYVALAVHKACPLLTADRKLHARFAGSPLARNLLWIEDLP